MSYQPKTGAACGCRRGQERDNCPACEGTGMRIDFAAIRARVASEAAAASKGIEALFDTAKREGRYGEIDVA